MTEREWRAFCASIERTAADVIRAYQLRPVQTRAQARRGRKPEPPAPTPPAAEAPRSPEQPSIRIEHEEAPAPPPPPRSPQPDEPGSLGPTIELGRPKTTGLRELRRDVREHRLELLELQEPLPQRPRTRGDCVDGPRPCPWVGCKWNLYLDVHSQGSLQHNFPGLEVDQVPNNCALDLADRGTLTLEQVGEVMNLTRERVRQIQDEALQKVRSSGELDAPEDNRSGLVYPGTGGST